MTALKSNTKGALLMMASMASFTMNDAFMKGLSTVLPLSQAVFLRGIATTLILLALAQAMGGLKLRLPKRDWKIILARNVTEVLMAYFFISAIFNMPFANATAIMQAIPLTITLAGAIFLREAVGMRRLSAILVGFFGVLLIVRPGFEGFNSYSIYVVLAVVMVTIRDLLVRRLSAEVPTMTVAFMNAVSVMVAFGLASTQAEWAPITTTETWKLAGAAVMVVGGYIFAVAAMRSGEIAVVAPFRYTALLWAIGLGFVFFGEWPDSLALLGGLVIVATGIYSFYRERQLAEAATTDNVVTGAVDKG